MAEATKRPWVADPDDRDGYEWNIHILQAANTNIRVCFMSNGPSSEANAALIVTAVNQHDALLKCAEALRKTKAYFEGDADADDCLLAARDALALLEKSNG
jgi:hypothetical protein